MLNLLSAALLAAASPGSAPPLPTAGPWNVDYGASSCVATRAYADGNRTLTLALRPSPIAGTMQIILVRDGRLYTSANQHGATIADSSGPTVTASQLDYAVPGKPPKWMSLLTLTDAQFATLGGKDEWRIRGEVGRPLHLAMRQLDGVKAELGKCVANLRTYWNMAPIAAVGLKSQARPVQPLASYFNPLDYPAQARREHSTGLVGVRMMIDETGKIADCATVQTSGSAILDAMSCIVLRQRARYMPAVGLDGKPMRSFADSRINWKLP